ncbi:MAG TPA: hypothetical protein VJ623_02970 [Holophagaceae bacterium]|nr:hypothetical protein [Holophagaceae bacterium]
MLPFPPALHRDAPQVPPRAVPPAHPRASGLRWVAAFTTHSGEVAVQEGHLYLDVEALRRAIKAPDLRGLIPEAAAWKVYTEARLPLAWRYEALVDLGGGYRARTLTELYRAHWAKPPLDAKDPVFMRFIQAIDVPKSMGDWTEYLLDGPRVHFRMNGGAWLTFANEDLARSTVAVDLALLGPEATPLRRTLGRIAEGEEPPAPPMRHPR